MLGAPFLICASIATEFAQPAMSVTGLRIGTAESLSFLSQLPIRLTAADLARFDTYAGRLGLDRTGLANLLLRRELVCSILRKADGGRVRRATGTRPKRVERITAHLPKECLDQFRSRAKELGLTLSAAGALVLVLELDHEWLLNPPRK